MQITQIDLENVKSYRQHSVTFAQGINAICGANGAGKSTLLEAIGFALFDALACTQEQFVREGEKIATVVVHLQGNDERAYQVVRKCGSYSQYYVYDPELDGKLADGKNDTVAWLNEFLGVDEMDDLSVLFRDAVGVPQGLLTAVFLEAAGKRKATFNPLLRVDEYEKVWNALLVPLNRLKEQIAEQDKQIAAYAAEVKALPGWQKSATDLQTQLQADQDRLAVLTVELEEASRRKETLEAAKSRLDALQQQIEQAWTQVQMLQTRLDEAQANLRRAQAAQQVIEETAAGYDAYQIARQRLDELETRRQERDHIKETIHDHTTDLRLAEEKTRELASKLVAIAQAEAQLATLRPQVQAQDRLQATLQESRLRVERLSMAERSLIQEQDRLTELKQRLSKAQDDLSERIRVEHEIAPLQQAADALDGQHNSLSAQLAACRAEIKQLEERVTRLQKGLADAERTLAKRQVTLTDLERRLSQMQSDLVDRRQIEQDISTLRDQAEAIQLEQNELTAQAATYQAESAQVTAQIGVLEAADTPECPVCGSPLTPAHRADLLAEHRARLAEIAAALAAAQSEQKKADKAQRQKRKALDALEKRLQDLPRPADETDLVERVESQRSQVAESEHAVADAQAEMTTNEGQRQALQATLSRLQVQRDEIETQRQEKRRALAQFQARLEALPRAGEVEEIAAQMTRQNERVAQNSLDIETLHDAPEQVRQIEADLAELGDPRRHYERAAETAAPKQAVQKEQNETQSKIADFQTQITALAAQLAVYADLDAQIEREREQKNIHEAAHQRYLQHIREAESLAAREATVDTLGDELAQARGEHTHLLQQCDRAAEQYDADMYAGLVRQCTALSDERATLNERLRLQQAQLEKARAEVTRLAAVQKALDAANAERSEMQEVSALLTYLRHILRDAGPKITQALVEVISLGAARMYADIMADHSARLRWTEDYEVLLAANGRERTFKQLSGGEQMAAALAVRLALLREVSDIDVAFFDEPTANLDEARRDNLAEQIMNVKGFSQLFVISHDDTFERDTDHVVRVIKENGVSQAGPEFVERMEG